MKVREGNNAQVNTGNIKTVIGFLFTFPFLKPTYFMAFDRYDDLFNILRIVSFSIITTYYFVIRRRSSPIAILIVFMHAFVLINTYFQGGDIYTCAKDSFPIVAIILLYDILINDDIDSFINSQLLCFEIVIYINLLTQFLYPGGIIVLKAAFKSVSSKWWFLGYYNTYTPYFIPAVVFSLLYFHRTGLYIRTTALISAVVLSSLMAKSGGNTLAIVIMVGVYLIFGNLTLVFNYYNYWLIQVVFYFYIIIMNAQNKFGWLLNDILKKTSSLKGRMLLWKRTINILKKSIWIGYGTRNGIYRVHETRVGAWAIYAHNLILELVYQGGLIYLMMFIALIILAGNKMMSKRDNEVACIISIGFLGWSIQSLVEAYRTPFLFGMFILAYYYDRFNRSISRKRVKFIM